jgi:hypothetical protein
MEDMARNTAEFLLRRMQISLAARGLMGADRGDDEGDYVRHHDAKSEKQDRGTRVFSSVKFPICFHGECVTLSVPLDREVGSFELCIQLASDYGSGCLDRFCVQRGHLLCRLGFLFETSSFQKLDMKLGLDLIVEPTKFLAHVGDGHDLFVEWELWRVWDECELKRFQPHSAFPRLLPRGTILFPIDRLEYYGEHAKADEYDHIKKQKWVGEVHKNPFGLLDPRGALA